jgi:predicted DNA-binding transcriptional regulator AlpA
MTTREKLRARAELELRLIGRGEVLDRVGMSYPTLWYKMRRGEFPRSVVIGTRVAWYAHEVEEWLRDLPRQKLKGDVSEETVEE